MASERPNPTFRRAVRAASRIAGRHPAVSRLLGAATALLERRPGALRSLRSRLAAVLRMTRDAIAGRYRPLPRRTLVAVVAALVYFVNPLDLIPDVLPLIGFADDAIVLAWLLRQVDRDLDLYLAWEREYGGAVDVAGELVPPDRLPAE